VAGRPELCWAVAAAAFAALVLVRRQPGGLLGIVVALETQQPYPKLLADVGLTTVLLALVMVPAVWDAPAGLPQRVLALAPFAWIGVVSYSIYLWHLTIAELIILPSMPFHFDADGLGLLQHFPEGGTVLMLVLTLAVSGAIAAVSYRYVELPFLRRKER
jgi:peptidoglycan/LPS O-acetylase OafA/YrhL